ncbi:hypothetical protein [Liquorilactobacillus hordei]|uniref:hypothetical protein n=1 Tax=Liquorilactobacillus hordei TaxID=468911 RepID=UPI001CBB52D2|nr:hypothetical protein [Liquorilactobacillus hordei]MBZ2406133.1 hypothetical protein [Liquorilactobacillus hordei]
MKGQLIELLKKANDGISAGPSVIKELTREYQMAHIGYLMASVILLVISSIILYKSLKAVSQKKSWTVRVAQYDYIPDEAGLSEMGYWIIILSISATCSSLVLIALNMGPAFAPSWYMLKDLIGR